MKRYIKPEATVVEIELQSMMAASPGMEIKDTVVNSDMGKEHNPMPGFDIWGDDEE